MKGCKESIEQLKNYEYLLAVFKVKEKDVMGKSTKIVL